MGFQCVVTERVSDGQVQWTEPAVDITCTSRDRKAVSKHQLWRYAFLISFWSNCVSAETRPVKTKKNHLVMGCVFLGFLYPLRPWLSQSSKLASCLSAPCAQQRGICLLQCGHLRLRALTFFSMHSGSQRKEKQLKPYIFNPLRTAQQEAFISLDLSSASLSLPFRLYILTPKCYYEALAVSIDTNENPSGGPHGGLESCTWDIHLPWQNMWPHFTSM